MQTESVKILKNTNNELYRFRHHNGNIEYIKTDGNFTSEPVIVKENVISAFSVCEGGGGNIYILCSDEDSIYFCKQNGSVFESRKIMNIPLSERQNSHFYVSISESGIHLIYNVEDTVEKKHTLLYLHYKDGAWETPVKIDTLVPFRDTPFYVAEAEKDHIILFYRALENSVNCRELLLSPLTIGNTNTIFQTRFAVSDLSFLVTEEKIHMLAVVKNMMTTQLIYKSKYQTKLSQPSLLYEGQRIESCLLFQSEKMLWAVWSANGQLYYSKSDNSGISFSTPSKYQGVFSTRFTKAQYINHGDIGYASSQLYIDLLNNDSILLAPQICPGFYGDGQKKDLYAASENNVLTMDRMKNRMESYESNIHDLNSQMMQLTKELADRSNDLSLLNIQWRTKYNLLKEKFETLEKAALLLQKENEELKASNSNLEAAINRLTTEKILPDIPKETPTSPKRETDTLTEE